MLLLYYSEVPEFSNIIKILDKVWKRYDFMGFEFFCCIFMHIHTCYDDIGASFLIMY